jgi:ankyrin repeat protein
MTGKADIESRTTGNFLPGRTPLSEAARYGHEAVVKLLLENGNVVVDSKSTGEYEPDWAPILWVADSDETVGKSNDTGNNLTGRTPLSWAVEGGHDGVVKLLLGKGADLNSKDKDGLTPLFWAARNGHDATVKTLLATPGVEADPTATGGKRVGRTPLSWAAERGHEQVVKLLLRQGARADSCATGMYDAGRTPLSYAAEQGEEAVVKLLLEQSVVEVNSKDGNDRTPLSHAAGRGHAAVVKLLLQIPGIDLDLKDTGGETPLSWAARRCHEAVAKLLQA